MSQQGHQLPRGALQAEGKAILKREEAVKANAQFDPESVHVCTKLSGEAAQFSQREKFDSIVRFLSAR